GGEARVRGLLATTRSIGQPAVADVDLLVQLRAGQVAGEVGHVGADRVVVPAVEAEQLGTGVAEDVVHHAQARGELPVELRGLAALGVVVGPLLGAHAGVDRPLVLGPGVLQVEGLALALHRVRRGGGLDDAVVVHLAGRVARGAGELVRVQLGLRHLAVAVGVQGADEVRAVGGGGVADAAGVGQQAGNIAAGDRAGARPARADEVGEAHAGVGRGDGGVARAVRAGDDRVLEVLVLRVGHAALDGVGTEGGVQEVLQAQAELVAVALGDQRGAAAALLALGKAGRRVEVGDVVARLVLHRRD